MTKPLPFTDKFPRLYDQTTYSNAVNYVSQRCAAIRRGDDGYTCSTFALIPVFRAWVKHNGRTAQTYAIMGRPWSSADLHYSPPSVDTMIAAAQHGEKTIDHSTGREVVTKQFQALHGW